MPTQTRECRIVNGSVEDSLGAGDGAYDLLDQHGSPAEIGQRIAESLQEVDLYSRRRPSLLEAGQALYVTIRIRVALADPTIQKEIDEQE